MHGKCRGNVILVSEHLLTSTWPHLRCDVGTEEGEYQQNCLCATVLCIMIMVHTGTSNSYTSVDCIRLWSCLI